MVTPCWQEAGTSVALFQVHDGCFDAALGLQLFSRLLTWTLTVPSEIWSTEATCLLDNPLAFHA